jgi:hypothetical protein
VSIEEEGWSVALPGWVDWRHPLCGEFTPQTENSINRNGIGRFYVGKQFAQKDVFTSCDPLFQDSEMTACLSNSRCAAKMAPWEFGKGWAEMRGFKRREPEVGGPEPPLIARAACEGGKDNSQQNLALGICGNALGHEIS